jgi:DNA uptake protein ComE-like DNA-binding protein
MSAGVLTLKSSKFAGSQPYEESGFWLDVNRRDGAYVRGHLLNHHVHGPGFNRNLVPIPKSTNTQMEQLFESKIKDRVLSEAQIVKYTVKGEWQRSKGRQHLPSEDFIPSALILSSEVLGDDLQPQKPRVFPFDKEEVRFEVALGPDVPAGFKRKTVVLKDSTEEDIAALPGIGATLAQKIVAERDSKPLRRFDDLAAFGVPDAAWKHLRDTPEERKFVKLFKDEP